MNTTRKTEQVQKVKPLTALDMMYGLKKTQEAAPSPLFAQTVAATGWNPLEDEQSPGEKLYIIDRLAAEEAAREAKKKQRLRAERNRRNRRRR